MIVINMLWLKIIMFQRPVPLKSNVKRRKLKKKRNFLELEVVPFESGVEVNTDRLKWGWKPDEKRCLENDDSRGEQCLCGQVDKLLPMTLSYTVMRVRTLLKWRCCSVAGSPIINYSVKYHEKYEAFTLTKRTRLLQKTKGKMKSDKQKYILVN